MQKLYAIVIILLLVALICAPKISFCLRYNIFKDNIYLDNNGTTMLCQEALDAYIKGSKLGNASSSYATHAKEIIQKNNTLVKSWLRCCDDYEIIYTSGASESNNTILKSLVLSAKSNSIPHIVLSSYEHQTSLDCVKQLENLGLATYTLINPTYNGIIRPNDVGDAVQANTVLVSIMHANNELGTINDIKKICEIVKKINPNIYFHIDAVQTFGKFSIPICDLGIDALSASYHKIYGPQGIGLLVVKKSIFEKIKQNPLICGSQNNGARGGTINIAGISGGYAALQEVIKNRHKKNILLQRMKLYIVECLMNEYNIGNYRHYYKKPDTYFVPNFSGNNKEFEIVWLGESPYDPSTQLPNTLLLSIVKYGPLEKHFCNIQLKKDLLKEKIIISIGSACHTDSPEPSHVLLTIGAPYIIRCGVIRISLGDYNNINEIKKFCQRLIYCINKQGNGSGY